ncbi:hypothetical protein HMPREF3050_06930 [Neisseria sp. HMSC065D04]|jgi:hypothetical protein|uniref:YwqG family protein n=1 Tax=Neisseria sp. HMSC065D04 TaxID=1739542 RepID=UPI0008A3EC68|nr:YwqG family protein [Neisseria sp. HMSC065D04]OFO31212.1 hypothetical protein HMPREF3050_06930 [Neisseria sp. HMSC065D04]
MYRPAVCFTLGEAAATTAYQSKIGGTPYLPKNAEYPYHAEKKHPLTLVAQINFSEVPPLPGFPERGILQVFVDGLDYGLGNNFENLSEQAGWRIMYYPELLPESELQTDFSAYQATDSECLPFSGEFPLIFQAASEEEEDADFNKSQGHKIGGSPIFLQGDPFLECDEDADFDDPATITCSDWRKYILLLQLDTDINEKDRYTGKLMWGDSGVANFFITPEDLAKRDFSRVAFVFDCC